jgi:hypothetical protein
VIAVFVGLFGVACVGTTEEETSTQGVVADDLAPAARNLGFGPSGAGSTNQAAPIGAAGSPKVISAPDSVDNQAPTQQQFNQIQQQASPMTIPTYTPPGSGAPNIWTTCGGGRGA